MADFKKPRFNSSSKRPFDRNASASRELFDTQCSKCGGRCQVPFRPNGKKPVYCANCFVKDDSQQSSYGNGPKRDFAPRRPDFAPQAQAPAFNPQIKDLEKKIEVMNGTLEKLVVALDSFNRATALTHEVRKHVTSAKPASAPVKADAKKPAVKKVVKTTKAVKKSA